ncbi:MAG: 16S rRNA (cytidine(1402)-2'-O)-methyltransferase [Ancalomicrobiaceae bacterium]|nr:16S rRNA (cytidine(1402)-2'-O)-methyltransferase [Ancalomicrobiaceae bacterium]
MSMRIPAKSSDPAKDAADGEISGRAFFIGPHRLVAPALPPALYIVATPIGNLGDITIRALETLAAVELVACEDTRVTRVLMDRYGLKTKLYAYHDHNAESVRPRLLSALAEGKPVALVSDAGTPLISDPGYKLVTAAAAAGHRVIPIPGASALLAGLVAAGLPTDSFLFAGFLSAREEARRHRIEELAALGSTIVFYESPHRLGETLAELAAVMGADRPAVIARELTKTFEELVRGPLGELAARYAEAKPKGEIVILVGPAAEAEVTDVDVDRLLAAALQHAAPGKAAAEVARLTGRNRKDLYERALALKPDGGSPHGTAQSGRGRP